MRKDRSAVFKTQRGWAGIAVSGRGITMVVLPRNDRPSVLRALRSHSGEGQERPVQDRRTKALCSRAVALMKGYFSGKEDVPPLPLDLEDATAFQRSVWRAAKTIPYGETRSYGWIAKRIRRPAAARAVGQAMGANPVPVLVP